VTSLGEGGISTERAIPIEARQTHVTQMGALDPIRTPESMRAGIDIRAAVTAQKDPKGDIYVPVYDVKTRREKYVKAGDLQNSVVMFPNQPSKGRVDVVDQGVVRRVPFSKVDYQIPHQSRMYSPTTNLIPFLESAQGNRAVMGSKMQVQALSLVDREAPYVQVATPSGKSFENMIGRIINPHAPVSGVVKKIDDDYIYLQPDGEKRAAKGDLIKVPYDKNFPLAAKTYLNHDLEVKKGDRVKANQRLGDSNFTRGGTLALGKNMSVAFMPYYGANSNDAVVVSEDAAKKLTSERMYKIVVSKDPDLTFSANKHKTYYGHNYTKDQYKPIDKDGVVAPGTKLLPGDPVIVGVRKTELSPDDLILGKLHKSLAQPHREFKQGWDHDHEGEVVDVVKTPKRITLTVKTKEPAGIGDKIAGRYGNKGVISEIVPTDQMVQDEAGKPIDVLMTSAGVVSRINPSQIIETAVGKVVEKTGKPIVVENFQDRDNVKWAKDLLKKHGVKDKETVYDPRSGKKIPKVFVGRQYLYKLFKTTDNNYSARSTGSYDMNLQPTRGGTQGSKRVGRMEFDALVGHNARNILREAATVKSQKNDEFWRGVQLGQTPQEPKSTFAYDKFLGMLTGAGVRVRRDGSRLTLGPLTDKDVLEMSAGEVKDAKIVRAKDLRPEAGGLFDPGVTGGLRGTRWSHVDLAEPVINPVFKEPVRRLLGMTNAQLTETLKEKGAAHIQKQLKKIDLDEKEKSLLKQMKGRKADQLDNEIKQVKYIRALRDVGVTPDKAYVVSKVPVVPPVMRPVVPGQGGTQIIYGDANPLYQDLIYINNQMKEVKNLKTPTPPGEEARLRPALQQAVGAVYGTDEPATAKSKARKHKGFLTYISGVGGPKHGFFQSKLMVRSQDMAGRGTIVPDSTLGVDEIGVPKEMLWGMYDKFVVRRLVQQGFPAVQAKQMVEKRHMAAEEALRREVQERPVLMNRAPTLHRYNIVGAKPVPVPGRTIRVNPFVEAGMNADYDGDSSITDVIVRITKPININTLPIRVSDIRNRSRENALNANYGIDSLLPEGYYNLHLRDFPRTKEVTVKDNKEIYKVPEGVQVFGFSSREQSVILCDVTEFSVHHNLEIILVTTESGRTAQVSKDDSMFGLNPITFELERFSGPEHSDWAIPRPSRLRCKDIPAVDKVYVPIVRDIREFSDDTLEIPLNEDTGWLLGAVVGDGWITYRSDSGLPRASAVGIASVDPSIQNKFKRTLTSLAEGKEPITFKLYENNHKYEGHTCHSEKLHMYGSGLATALGEVFQHTTGAANKHLPDVFTNAPREFLIGLLAGLLDTDGTVSIVKAKAKKQPQVVVHYTTISPRLADEVATLGLLLGVKTKVHTAKRKTSADNKEYQVHFSTPDLKSIAKELPCAVQYKRDNLKTLASWDFSLKTISSKTDRVPLPSNLVAPLKKLVGPVRKKEWDTLSDEKVSALRKRESIHVILSKAKRTGKIGRSTLEDLIEIYGRETVAKVTSPKWLELVTNPYIIWDWIKDITPIEGRHTAWDLTVPDGNTFMTSNQLIVYDTMQLHVPVGPKAVQEAKDITLSNLLFGDKSKSDLLVFPQHEAIMGIHHASRMDDKNKTVKKFKTKADAIAAYKRGDISLGTRVKIGG
ncbi:MAG: hypothetical protein DRP83_02280, partial [Planctomycetota bacterium]